jgi:arsenate reductase (glutaredoxin)
VPRFAFYTKPTCSTCRNAKSYLEKAGVELDQIDINVGTPSRAFLERHIDAAHFLDFVSTHSPVFKTRPLPESKQEAIDLMLENANLIKRPILVRGRDVIFGFDKKRYGAVGIT